HKTITTLWENGIHDACTLHELTSIPLSTIYYYTKKLSNGISLDPGQYGDLLCDYSIQQLVHETTSLDNLRSPKLNMLCSVSKKALEDWNWLPILRSSNVTIDP
ncbi:9518_t:CDS:2, partial [Entrophospora sp. SA101]